MRWKLVLGFLIVGFLASMKSHAQLVTINKKKASLQEILLDIYDQTKFYFYTNTDLLKKTKKVNINVKNVSISTALDIAFRNQPVKYELKGQVIIVSKKDIPSPVIVETDNIEDTSVQELDRVQVIGYGTTTRRLSTGNVNSVTGEVIQMQPVTNPLLALQGRVPGLIVTQTNGLPGSPVNVQIRGRNSIAASNNPLYIVDGVPFTSSPVQIIGGPNGDGTLNYGSPFNLINPDDIESIDILKDADATSIYGSRGANGVIIITTRKAKDDKLHINANVNAGFGKVTRMPPMMNTQQYLQVRRDGLKNSGLPVNAQYAPDLVLWDTTKYFDWQKWYMGNTANIFNANLGVSFGTDRSKFMINGTFHDETSVLPGDTRYRRESVHGSYQYLSKNKRFELLTNTFWTGDRNKLNGNINGALAQIAMTPPNYPVYDSTGKYYWYAANEINYMAEMESYYKSKANNINANTVLKYSIQKNLNVNVSIGYNDISNNEVRVIPAEALNPVYGVPQALSVFGKQRMITYLAEPQINYSIKVFDGKLDLLAGSTYQQNNKKGNYKYVNNFHADADLENPENGTVFYKDSIETFYRYLSFFGRFVYDYENKYIVSGTLRRDGSSRFGPDKQFGNFYSIAGAWLFSNENIVRDKFPALSFGKLRTSYGTTGNDGISDYGFMSTYASTQPYGNSPTIHPSQPANNDYRWELTKMYEAALELGFFRNRILFSTAWYNNTSTDQLLPYGLPSMTGFESYQANLPAVVVNRGWEFELNTVNVRTDRFKWSTETNICFQKNKLQAFPGLEQSTYANTLIIGYPLDNIQGLIFTGIDRTTGEAQFRDVYKDGIINYTRSSYNSQGGDKVFIANSLPAISGGMLNKFTWKQFQLDFLIQYVKQRGYGLASNYSLMGQIKNTWTTFSDYWKYPGDDARYPAPGADISVNSANFTLSDQTVKDATFVRLKNVYLSYDLSSIFARAKYVRSAKVYIQVQNLLTFSGYDRYDPETSANIYMMVPPLKAFQLGAKISM